MNDRQISALLNSNNMVAKSFRGVFPRDADIQPVNGAYIFNTDKASDPGTHWVVCIIDSKSGNFYFDSYGLPPLFSEFEMFMKPAYYYNNQRFQQLTSAVCGHYCVYYITQYAKGFSHQQILEFLSQKKKPDLFVALFINQVYSVNLEIFDIPYVKKQICNIQSHFYSKYEQQQQQ